MCSHPLDVDVEERAPAIIGPERTANLPTGSFGRLWMPKYRVAGKLLEEPVLDHRLRPPEPLLGRLEDEEHLALEVAGLGEVAGRPEEHRGVPVVPAGVHPPVVPRSVREPRRLLDRQRVHVRPKPHRARRVADPKRPDDPGAPDAR